MSTGPGAVALDVSRETYARLQDYVRLLEKWNPSINLVSKTTLPDVWNRHILDSVQISTMARPGDGRWADLGSGGGLPGLVVAIVLAGARPEVTVTLVESDMRKAAFLKTTIAALDLQTKVLADRIERVEPLAADVVSARALAPLDRLLGLSWRHLAPGGQCIFPKGRAAAAELAAARENWRFQCEEIPSKTSSEAVILRLQEITRV